MKAITTIFLTYIFSSTAVTAGTTTTKYDPCNKWLKKRYPQDKMFKLGKDGKIHKGKNATQTFVVDEKTGDVEIAWQKLDKKNKHKVEKLSISIEKGSDGSYLIRRRHGNESNFPTVGYGAYQQQWVLQQQLAYQQRLALQSKSSNFNNGGGFGGAYPASNDTHSTVELKIGENGQCYVNKVNEHSSRVSEKADTKRCYEIKKFNERFPQLKSCGNKNIFKQFAKVVYGKGVLKDTFSSVGNSKGGLSEEFEEGLTLANRVINKAAQKLATCDKMDVSQFARQDDLFYKKPPLKTSRDAAGLAIDNN